MARLFIKSRKKKLTQNWNFFWFFNMLCLSLWNGFKSTWIRISLKYFTISNRYIYCFCIAFQMKVFEYRSIRIYANRVHFVIHTGICVMVNATEKWTNEKRCRDKRGEKEIEIEIEAWITILNYIQPFRQWYLLYEWAWTI